MNSAKMLFAVTTALIGSMTAAAGMATISTTANRYPTGGTTGASIPVSVKLVCFSSTVCPTDPFTGAAITEDSMRATLSRLQTKYFTSGTEVLAKFALERFEKIVEPEYYNPTASDFLTPLTQRYGDTDSVNVFVVNDAAYGGLGYIDQNLGSKYASVVVMHHGVNSDRSHLLAHELMHTMGGTHAMDDWGSTTQYNHPECGSNFSVPTQLSSSGDFNIVTSTGCNSNQFKYNNVMSYAADWSCGNTPTLYTQQWYFDPRASKKATSKRGIDKLPATYGNFYRVAMKCWNYRNF